MKAKKKIFLTTVMLTMVIAIVAVVLVIVSTKDNVLYKINENQGEAAPKALDVSSWDTSKVTVYTDKSGNVAPIPKGYVASQVTGETEIDTGLVIYEGTEPVKLIDGEEFGVYNSDPKSAWQQSCTRNQWVWVPVADVNRIYDKDTGKSKLYSGSGNYSNNDYEPAILRLRDSERYFSQCNLPGMTRETLLYELKVELRETVKSIEMYGGFYIGRYETGNVTNNGSTHYVKPVVQRMQGDMSINYVSWYEAYKNLIKLGANENVKANIIYGCLWDETIQWFIECGVDSVYPASWGNYRNSEEFTYYTNASGRTGTKQKYGEILIPTGATERNKVNNIYDMGGNVWEWTLEGNNNGNRIIRGECYSGSVYNNSISKRSTYSSNYSSKDKRCACILLYKIN